MDSSWLSLVEMLFVYGALLAFLGWQLVDVNRAAKRSKAKRDLAEAEARIAAGAEDGTSDPSAPGPQPSGALTDRAG